MRIKHLIALLLAAVFAGLVPRGTAADAAAVLTQVALVSDPHITAAADPAPPLNRKHLDEVIAAVNEAGVALVLIAGDLTEHGKAVEMEAFKQQIAGFRAPVLFVAGNHDVGMKKMAGKEGGVTAARVAAFEAKLGPAFFAKTVAGLRVVGVTGSLFGSGLSRENDQWAFLEKELARPAALPTLLLTHYPMFQNQPDEPGGVYWNIEPQPRARLRALLRRGSVRAVLSGHLHHPLRNQCDGIAMIGAPAVSFGLPRNKQPEGWTLVTVPPQGEPPAAEKYISH